MLGLLGCLKQPWPYTIHTLPCFKCHKYEYLFSPMLPSLQRCETKFSTSVILFTILRTMILVNVSETLIAWRSLRRWWSLHPHYSIRQKRFVTPTSFILLRNCTNLLSMMRAQWIFSQIHLTFIVIDIGITSIVKSWKSIKVMEVDKTTIHIIKRYFFSTKLGSYSNSI